MKATSLLGVLLDFLESLDGDHPAPADVRLSRFFRERRFLGSKDRRFVGDGAYAFLRHDLRGQARWRAWCQRTELSPREEGRTLHIGSLLAIAQDGLFPWEATELAETSSTYAAAVGGGWTEVLERIRIGKFLEEDDWPADPLERLAAELSLPVWLARRLVDERGEEEARLLGEALLLPAPVDLRVNVSRIEREVVRSDLESAHGAEVSFTPLSPHGLRIHGRINFRQFLSKNPGWAELQDEGSQIAAIVSGVRPGDTVIDACAGGGGKTLALSDIAGGQGRFHVCDIDVSKLDRLLRRAEPAGLKSLTPHQISPDGDLPSSLPSKADLVVCDVPCSGMGSLRRNPDLKTRYGEDDIAEFAEAQAGILERFSSRVRPGGRLVYITCSLLAQENEDVVEAFAAAHPEYRLAAPVLPEGFPEASRVGKYLRLDPISSGTDGFFVACFDRVE